MQEERTCGSSKFSDVQNHKLENTIYISKHLMVRNVGRCALQVCLVSRRVFEPPEFVLLACFPYF
jgi:hypothetical protein